MQPNFSFELCLLTEILTFVGILSEIKRNNLQYNSEKEYYFSYL